MVMNLSEVFATRLRQAIDEWKEKNSMPNATLTDFARAIDVPPSTIYSYTNNRHALPSIFMLYILCSSLDVSADWLIGLSDEKSRINYNQYSE